ncbi:hypothetical protein OOK29_03470 [Streptomyces phaeochromogenes]|uniref:hypothetical protein n=1 Tax=Streptomyces phaeochromogenes TaxID=1923 RepID=UPI00224EE49D|nr:hypothetical protein [Streptomyces phaeochromogenes]MCX5597187.1 hypothetical protein [Streptomyces phaeochromogenes]
MLLIEYAQVKDEQKARIGFRGNLLYATVRADEGRVLLLRRGRLSEVTDSPEIRHLEQAGRYDDFVVHPDGDLLAAAGSTELVRVWHWNG